MNELSKELDKGFMNHNLPNEQICIQSGKRMVILFGCSVKFAAYSLQKQVTLISDDIRFGINDITE